MCGLVILAMTWYEDQFKSHHTWLPVSAETTLAKQSCSSQPLSSPLPPSEHLPQAQQAHFLNHSQLMRPSLLLD